MIPVYNGSRSIAAVVETIHQHFADLAFEVVLVNDGSRDDSEQACLGLVERHPQTLRFVHLARNFGEQSWISSMAWPIQWALVAQAELIE